MRLSGNGGTLVKHASAIFILVVTSLSAQAQDLWPSRSVRFIAPVSPGGATDVYARLLAQGLGEALKQQFVVENRAGASGNIGAEIVTKAAPDGYTFLVSSSAALVINPSLFKNLAYSAERDLAPVARGVFSPTVFSSHPSLPAKTLPALVSLAKREPGKLTYGSPGSGSPGNIGVKMLEEITGARFVHVPYKGAGEAIIGLLRGEIMFMVSDINTAFPHVQSGKIHALVTSQRTVKLPSVPSLADVGYPEVQSEPSFSVTAPARTSVAIIQRLGAEIVKTMKVPSIKEKLDAQSLIPVFDTPDEFAVILKKERMRYAEIIRRNKIAVE
jgi:tripartite-type tricarboxylate transporter receptor subunit TctC